MNSEELDKVVRWRKNATTWTRKTTAILRHFAAGAKRDEERWLIGYEAQQLLAGVLDDLADLAALLVDDQVEEIEEAARDLASTIRRRRLAGKLANVEGRTVEEAQAFLAKADELRSA